MCGIAGIVDTTGRWSREQLEQIATTMRDTLVHRGPDDAGTWVDPTGTCALAHRRLSIVDLSEQGRQPMVTPDGQVGLTFNGEIYNYRELREDLLARGYAFHSETDSEVLLYQFASCEPFNLSKLEGMYAFASWNANTRRLLLARDAFGKKPLYLASGPGWLAFASELQALLTVPGIEPRVCPEAVSEYLLLQYVPAPRSIIAGTEKLLPGHWATFEFAGGDEAPQRHDGRHFSFEPEGDHITRSPYRPLSTAQLDEAADALMPILLGATERRLMSDVPLGAFLSGGIDSALVVAMMTRELGMDVQSFSIGFEGTDESEHLLAREASELLGTTHHEKMLEPDAIELMPRIAAALDEPLGDSSCLPTYLLSEFTREHVTVALSGDGGDELFGGYGRYRETLREEGDWKMRALYMARNRRIWKPGPAYCSLRWLMFMPEDVGSIAGPEAGAHAERFVSRWISELDDTRRPLIHRMRGIDARTYMPGAVLAKVDRMSMQFALEVRAPLLDRSVARFAEGLGAELVYQDGLTKPLLRHLAGRYLPKHYIERKKMGFGLPGKAWTQADILGLCEDVLLGSDGRIAAAVGPQGVAGFVAHQRQENCFSIFQVWTVLMLEFWLRAHVPASPVEARV
ncbi:MAG: asparagine synthase (glutamine-hydrolyzing) [Planctomycetota bacterium]|nr:MAG: asparagine synthase (glutamine-hydrolyzing) [Planctomycetota bacterium]